MLTNSIDGTTFKLAEENRRLAAPASVGSLFLTPNLKNAGELVATGNLVKAAELSAGPLR